MPGVPTILPIAAMPGPDDPEERVEAIVAGMRRLAPFEPTAFVCLTGPAAILPADEARRVVVESLRVLGDEGEQLGVPVGRADQHLRGRRLDDPDHARQAAELIHEAGSPGLGLVVDTWHLGDTPQLEEEIERFADRIVAVRVNDWRDPTRAGAIGPARRRSRGRRAGPRCRRAERMDRVLRPRGLLRRRHVRKRLRGLVVEAPAEQSGRGKRRSTPWADPLAAPTARCRNGRILEWRRSMKVRRTWGLGGALVLAAATLVAAASVTMRRGRGRKRPRS